jgi:3-(3-hydroxy-phenyl)propionate hydroxylase
VHGPLPGGEHRWEFLLGAGEDAAAVERSAVVADLLSARLGGPAPAVRRAAVYVFHARVAARWRVGRILLLGDAAHLAPPFAGQGLGAGLRDAHNLAWKVAAVVRDGAAEGVLDTYAVERRPHVVRMTALAEALGALVQLRRGRAARVRDGAMRALARRAGVQTWVARGGWKPPSTIRRGLVASGAHGWRAGEPLPQVPGAPPLGPGWTLVGEARGASAEIVTWLAPAAVALVRPDGVVFGTGAVRDVDSVLRAAAGAIGGAVVPGVRPGGVDASSFAQP